MNVSAKQDRDIDVANKLKDTKGRKRELRDISARDQSVSLHSLYNA